MERITGVKIEFELVKIVPEYRRFEMQMLNGCSMVVDNLKEEELKTLKEIETPVPVQ